MTSVYTKSFTEFIHQFGQIYGIDMNWAMDLWDSWGYNVHLMGVIMTRFSQLGVLVDNDVNSYSML